jgi:sRNA-binding regulator protein Hfq
MMNRKLIRPNLSEYKEKPSRDRDRDRQRDRSSDRGSERGGDRGGDRDRGRDRDRDTTKKKSQPSYETHAENYYYLKQMNKKVLMTIVFNDGEIVHGYVEWYDRDCLKLNREGAPNLLIYKSGIKYLYKHEPDQPAAEKGQDPSNTADKG